MYTHSRQTGRVTLTLTQNTHTHLSLAAGSWVRCAMVFSAQKFGFRAKKRKTPTVQVLTPKKTASAGGLWCSGPCGPANQERESRAHPIKIG